MKRMYPDYAGQLRYPVTCVAKRIEQDKKTGLLNVNEVWEYDDNSGLAQVRSSINGQGYIITWGPDETVRRVHKFGINWVVIDEYDYDGRVFFHRCTHLKIKDFCHNQHVVTGEITSRRICAREGCGKKIGGRQSNAKWCSHACRHAASKQHSNG